MLFFVLDDEPFALKASCEVVQQAYPDAEILSFGRSREALQIITEKKRIPDVVFSDIEMPGMNGLAFALELKKAAPHTYLIFVTGYSQYALDAFRVHAHGYILKPMTVEQVREECARIPSLQGRDGAAGAPGGAQQAQELSVKCFGYFEVFWEGKPLMFSRKQTKELLAYLVDRKGDACTSEEIASALWEDEDNLKNLKARIRILISDLRQSLKQIGREDLLIRRSGRVAILADQLDCDYYRMLKGDMDALNSFEGEYMLQYSWAEMTAGQLLYKY